MLTVRKLLEEHMVQWMHDSGVPKKQAEFAAYIGESDKYLSMVMNGRKASKRQIEHFANFFKDPRFYDAAEMDRPEMLLSYTRRNWPNVPEEVKRKIAEEVASYTTEPLPDGEGTEAAEL